MNENSYSQMLNIIQDFIDFEEMKLEKSFLNLNNNFFVGVTAIIFSFLFVLFISLFIKV